MRIQVLDIKNKPLDYITQWNKNVRIQIIGWEYEHLPRVIYSVGDNSYTVDSFEDGELILAEIPNDILVNSGYIIIDVCAVEPIDDAKEQRTVYSKRLRVYSRPKPSDAVYPPNTIDLSKYFLIKDVEAELNELFASILGGVA